MKKAKLKFNLQHDNIERNHFNQTVGLMCCYYFNNIFQLLSIRLMDLALLLYKKNLLFWFKMYRNMRGTFMIENNGSLVFAEISWESENNNNWFRQSNESLKLHFVLDAHMKGQGKQLNIMKIFNSEFNWN